MVKERDMKKLASTGRNRPRVEGWRGTPPEENFIS